MMTKLALAALFLLSVVWGVAGAMHAYDLSIRVLVDQWWGFPAYMTLVVVLIGGLLGILSWKR